MTQRTMVVKGKMMEEGEEEGVNSEAIANSTYGIHLAQEGESGFYNLRLWQNDGLRCNSSDCCTRVH